MHISQEEGLTDEFMGTQFLTALSGSRVAGLCPLWHPWSSFHYLQNNASWNFCLFLLRHVAGSGSLVWQDSLDGGSAHRRACAYRGYCYTWRILLSRRLTPREPDLICLFSSVLGLLRGEKRAKGRLRQSRGFPTLCGRRLAAGSQRDFNQNWNVIFVKLPDMKIRWAVFELQHGEASRRLFAAL
jgi:hypothetical protein